MLQNGVGASDRANVRRGRRLLQLRRLIVTPGSYSICIRSLLLEPHDTTSGPVMSVPFETHDVGRGQ